MQAPSADTPVDAPVRTPWGRRLALLAATLVLAACGGGSSVETSCIGCPGVEEVTEPSGPNTTDIVVDAGPGFSLGAVNVPSVTVTVCEPGSTSACVTIDHVFLDTGSIGLRLFKSRLGTVSLPRVAVPADAATSTPAGPAVECYAFVLGAVWGPMARADIQIGGEAAPGVPIQLIDDGSTPEHDAPADCLASANGGLLKSVSDLQANGILGIGMLAYDCGLTCANANYGATYPPYFSCPAGGCVPAAMPSALQAQNPIVHFLPDANNVVDNNGSVIVMPPLPAVGATLAKGRLVFGIGTRSNNQLGSAKVYTVDNDPASATYLYLGTQVGARSYASSYIDSGSNAYFFDDASLPLTCSSQSDAGGSKGWFCPAAPVTRQASLIGADGSTGSVDFTIGNADTLFGVDGVVALANLGGSVGQGTDTFVWGLPFFYGRSVFTSIWGQPLATNGPWNAF